MAERYANPGQREPFPKQGSFRRLVLVRSFGHGHGGVGVVTQKLLKFGRRRHGRNSFVIF